MRIHYLQHVPFEDLANIEQWARSRGHEISRTLLCEDEKLPQMQDFDWLIIMGGPMNIYEHEKYLWLKGRRSSSPGPLQRARSCLGSVLAPSSWPMSLEERYAGTNFGRSAGSPYA